MKYEIPNLSRAVSLIVQYHRRESDMHADIRAWGAPGECHEDLSRGEASRFRDVRKHIEGVTGFKYKMVRAEILRRVSAKFAYNFFGGL